jgi:hypothetical protein
VVACLLTALCGKWGRPSTAYIMCVCGRELRPLRPATGGGGWTMDNDSNVTCVVWLAHVCGACSSCAQALSQVVCLLGVCDVGAWREHGVEDAPRRATHATLCYDVLSGRNPPRCRTVLRLWLYSLSTVAVGTVPAVHNEMCLPTAVHVHVWLLTQRRARGAGGDTAAAAASARATLCCCCRVGLTPRSVRPPGVEFGAALFDEDWAGGELELS